MAVTSRHEAREFRPFTEGQPAVLSLIRARLGRFNKGVGLRFEWQAFWEPKVAAGHCLLSVF